MKKNQHQSAKERPGVSRREFLRDSAAASVGAAIAVGVPGVAMSAEEKPDTAERTRDKGYQLTGHVKKYYQTLQS